MMQHRVSGLLAVAAIFALASFAGRTALSQSAAPSIAEVDQAILAELALSHQILVNEGVLDAYGHVSIRHPKNPNRFLMARSGEVAPAYATATPSSSRAARCIRSASSTAKSTRCGPT
jgi:hypothetical protein